jgi:hypothetical protein
MRNMYAHPAYTPRGVMKVLPFWEYRYPRTFIGLDTTGAALCVIAGAFLCAVGYYPWGVVVLAVAALRSWIAYQLVQFVHS